MNSKQKQARNKIELIKRDFAAQLQSDTLKYKRAVIREIDSLRRQMPDKDDKAYEQFAVQVLRYLKVPASIQSSILSGIKETQTQIIEIWDEYFNEKKVGDASLPLSINYEKLIAAYSVDFTEIAGSTRDLVVKAFRESVNKEYGFETIRTKLLKMELGSNQVYTLANTAVAQFDNAAMFEFARQAGVEKYQYDGVLSPTSRDFCVRHFRKIYTYEEIMAMDNGQGLPVWTSCGGYNCQHFWTPIIKL